MKKMVSLMLLGGVAACAPSPQSSDNEPAPLETTADETLLAEQKQCIELLCPATDNSCIETSCALQEAQWDVMPTRVRHDPENAMLSVAAKISYTPKHFGPVPIERKTPAYVGVTAFTTTGEEASKPLDLAIQTLIPPNLSEEILFLAPLPEGDQLDSLIISAWDMKVEPCDDERPGCKDYGFLLDAPLASWPARNYDAGNMAPPSLPTDTVTLNIVYRSGSPQALQAGVNRLMSTLSELVRPFGGGVQLKSITLTPREAKAAPQSQLQYGSPRWQYFAERLAIGLGSGEPENLAEWRGVHSSGYPDRVPGGETDLTWVFDGGDTTPVSCGTSACEATENPSEHLACLVASCAL